MTVTLHVEDDGRIVSPFGEVADVEPCVLIGADILDWTRHGHRPLCKQARKILGFGACGSAHTDGDVMTVDTPDRIYEYRIYGPVEWSDGGGHVSPDPMYLGVLQ